MTKGVVAHYASNDLAGKIADSLRNAGKDLRALTTVDLAPFDEFHFRGRKATLELATAMNLNEASHVLDIGSGLGGPARTVAEEYGCQVTGVDLTQAFCDVAAMISDWVGLGDRTRFQQGDATNLGFPDHHFDAAMTFHVSMNIQRKDKVHEQAARVLRPGGIFAVYDVLQGEGGEVSFPVPWAENRSLSHLATPAEMEALLSDAGFRILDVHDSTDESQSSLEAVMTRLGQKGAPVVSSPTQILFGDRFPEMARNQIRGLAERRIRTVSYVCEA